MSICRFPLIQLFALVYHHVEEIQPFNEAAVLKLALGSRKILITTVMVCC